MSLGFALDMTMRGLLSTTSRIQLTSQNITNAGKAGYTRKEGSDTYVTTNAGTVPVKTNIIGSTDRYLTKSVVGDVSEMGKASAISEILEYYSSQLGSTSGTSTLSSYLNNMYGAFQQLAVSPETLANKTEAVQLASNMSASLRGLSGNIQELRLQAEQKITDTVKTVNDNIDQIYKINSSIVPGETADAQMAEFEDQRMAALENLAKTIDIQYYFTSQNQVQIFTSSGQPLLQTEPKHISYSPTTTVTTGTVFQPMMLNGTDITSSLRQGTLAGNIAIRDQILPAEQAKIDEFASVLKTQMNTLTNKGASLPPRSSMTGSLQGLTAASPLSATGSLRVAVVDNSGVLQNYADVVLGSITTVGGLITALNGIPNVNASLDVNGALVVKSTVAGTGISLNELNSKIGTGQVGASMYFGLQDMFTGNTATFLKPADYLAANPNTLQVGVLNSGTIATGDTVITRGDGTNALAMSQILKSNVSFNAAGNFSAQSNTLTRYVEAFMADGATQAKLADTQYEAANAIYSTTKETLNNKSGVNIDEETTKLLALQNAYQSSARMISTIKDCFQALLNAVG